MSVALFVCDMTVLIHVLLRMKRLVLLGILSMLLFSSAKTLN